MAMNDGSKSVFSKYIADSLERHEPEIPRTNLKLLPVGRLLNWILNYWDERTISARDIYTYGPRCIQNLQDAVGVAEILVQQGWLIPVRAHRHDRKLWLVVRGAETEAGNQTTIAQPLKSPQPTAGNCR
jgi:hypothetical protein